MSLSYDTDLNFIVTLLQGDIYALCTQPSGLWGVC